MRCVKKNASSNAGARCVDQGFNLFYLMLILRKKCQIDRNKKWGKGKKARGPSRVLVCALVFQIRTKKSVREDGVFRILLTKHPALESHRSTIASGGTYSTLKKSNVCSSHHLQK
jgi:hypothetical protein